MTDHAATLAAALEAATDALSALAMRASCAPNDDADAADRELGKIMREAYAARDAAALALADFRRAARTAQGSSLARPEDAPAALDSLSLADRARSIARANYADPSDDDIEVDDDARVSQNEDGGAWVAAWVYVHPSELADD